MLSDSKSTIENIITTVNRIDSLEESVRKYINTNRYQTDLLQNLDIWNQICCSLDTIGDTLFSFSIQDYIKASYPESDGLKYIYTYGILQALFIQQDAMRHLSEAFEIKFELSEKLQSVRSIRNASIGHPTKNKVKGRTYFNYISRITLFKYGFTLMRSSEQDRTEFIEVNLLSILDEQLYEIESSYDLLSAKLIEADKMHREKYKDRLIVDIFHSSMGYSFSKVAEGIFSGNRRNVSFGLSMLKSIEKTYQEFEAALSERNELNEYTEYNLNQYKHTIFKLKEYFSNSDSGMTESDAMIYHFYIHEQHNHFVQIANEIDAEYTVKVYRDRDAHH